MRHRTRFPRKVSANCWNPITKDQYKYMFYAAVYGAIRRVKIDQMELGQEEKKDQ